MSPFAKIQQQNRSFKPQRIANARVENALGNIIETGDPGVIPCEALGNGVIVPVEEAQAVQKWLADNTDFDNPPPHWVRLGLLQ